MSKKIIARDIENFAKNMSEDLNISYEMLINMFIRLIVHWWYIA